MLMAFLSNILNKCISMKYYSMKNVFEADSTNLNSNQILSQIGIQELLFWWSMTHSESDEVETWGSKETETIKRESL